MEKDGFYRLYVEGKEPEKCDLLNRIERTFYEEYGRNVLCNECGEDIYKLNMTQDQAENVMKILSKKYPGSKFILEFESERGEGKIRLYFMNGSCARVKGELVFPCYSDAELKSLTEQQRPYGSILSHWSCLHIYQCKIPELFEARDCSDKLVALLDSEELRLLRELPHDAEKIAALLAKMRYIYLPKYTSYEQYFDEVLMTDEDSCVNCRYILKFIPKELKRAHVINHPDTCVIGDGIYRLAR